jgi:tetratricopeptide (TPR) repeat protein
MKNFNFFLIPLLVFLNSCSTPEESMTEIEFPAALQSARSDIKNGDYAGAESHIKKYLGNPQDVYWHGHAYLLLGEARETSGQLNEALEAYKQAITQGTGFDQKITVQALYRISWIYEKQQDFQNLSVVLQDLARNLTAKDYFIKYIENPSRLANAYFALGMWDKALEQRSKVTPEVITASQLRAPSMSGLHRAQLYRSFVMLKATDQQLDPTLLIPLTQKELLDVGEMAEMGVSAKALGRIKNLYELQWKKISAVKTVKKLEERLVYNKTKLDEYAQFMDQIQDLKSSRRPTELIANPQGNADLFRAVSVIEKEVRAAVNRLEMGVQKAPKRSKS